MPKRHTHGTMGYPAPRTRNKHPSGSPASCRTFTFWTRNTEKRKHWPHSSATILYYNILPPRLSWGLSGMVGKIKRSKPEYHCLYFMCLSLHCACCSSVHVAPNRQLTHSQNLPTILHPSPLQILVSPFYTNSIFTTTLNISLCYIWLKNCGINLRSKIMPKAVYYAIWFRASDFYSSEASF